MLDYFKNNPADLLDAFPTPEGSEDGEPKVNHLADFTTGLTPKKNFKFSFKSEGLLNKSSNSRAGANRPPGMNRRSICESPLNKSFNNNQALTPYKKDNRLNSASSCRSR